jgi:hypothetical protein
MYIDTLKKEPAGIHAIMSQDKPTNTRFPEKLI